MIDNIKQLSENIFQDNYKFKQLNKAIYWRRIVKNTLNLIIHLLNSFRFIMANNHRKYDERIIVFSQIFDSIEEKNKIDHYFGNIFEKYETKHENHILWTYLYDLNFRSKKSNENKILLKEIQLL